MYVTEKTLITIKEIKKEHTASSRLISSMKGFKILSIPYIFISVILHKVNNCIPLTVDRKQGLRFPSVN